MEVVKRQPKQKILENGAKHYQYHFLHVMKTIILFPFVVYYSKKYTNLFIKFCFDYQRRGTYINQEQEQIKFNSLALYHDDITNKKLTKFGYMFTAKAVNITEIMIKNKAGKLISCLSIKHKNSKKWVIGLHGWTENKYLGIRLVWWFYQQGYNVLTFDSMAHGKSYGQYTDIGYTSAHDLVDIISWLKSNNDINSIGIIGNSMGASCGLYFCQNFKEPLLKWVIADSPFAHIVWQYRYVMEHRYEKPWWLVSYRLAAKMQQYHKVNLKKYHLLQPKTDFTDILLIHGKNDTFVPFFMSKVIEQQYNNNVIATLFLENINHIETLHLAHQKYITKIDQFIKKKEAEVKLNKNGRKEEI